MVAQKLPAFLDDIPDEDIAEIVEVVPPDAIKIGMHEPLPVRTHEDHQQDRLRAIEDDLLKQSLTVMDDALAFRDINPNDTEPPPEWVKRVGYDEALKRLRIANAAWMNAKQAPVGIGVAKSLAVGIIKARATEKSAPKSLNVSVQVIAVAPAFPELEVET